MMVLRRPLSLVRALLLVVAWSSCSAPVPAFQLLELEDQGVSIYLMGVDRPEAVSIIGEPADYGYDPVHETFLIRSAREIRVSATVIRLEGGEVRVGDQTLAPGAAGAPRNYVIDERGAVIEGFIRTFD